MSRFQRISVLSLNLFDSCVTPASTSSRSDVGQTMVRPIYLANEYLSVRLIELQIVNSIPSQDMINIVFQARALCEEL
ncbi:hypothetical protein EDB85DRAFT_1993643 [Lactarius pseudohatsudake]|nr:hypothetical protein EDB85DRAFT_1993643 [Lactarius pseudohatsudake]